MALQDKLQEVMKAAIEGPGIKGITIKGHGFNVDKAKIEETADGKIKVNGLEDGDNISHRQGGIIPEFDDQVYYSFTVQVDESGAQIPSGSASLKEGGFLNTWGAPIVFVIEEWETIECFFDDEKEVEDCDILGLVKALYNAVKLNSSDFDIGEVDEISIAELENKNMTWQEVVELMILSIASRVMGDEIVRKKPSWITDKKPIKIVAPDFDDDQVTEGISRDEDPIHTETPDFDDDQVTEGVNLGVVRTIGTGVGVLFDTGNGPPVVGGAND